MGDGKGVAILTAILVSAAIVGGMYYIALMLTTEIDRLYNIPQDDDGGGQTIPSPIYDTPEWIRDSVSRLQTNGGIIMTKDGCIEDVTAGQSISYDNRGIIVHRNGGTVYYTYEDIRMIYVRS